MGLLHLQQNIVIPEISLTFHLKIVEAVKRAESQNRKPSAEDLGDAVSDTTFLNALQKNVGIWVKEIKKVCCCCWLCVGLATYKNAHLKAFML